MHFEWTILDGSFGRAFFHHAYHITTWFYNVWFALCSRWDWITPWGQDGVCYKELRPERGQRYHPPLLSVCSKGGNDLIRESAHTRQVALTSRLQAWKKSGQTPKLMHCGVYPHVDNVWNVWPTETVTLNPTFPWVLMYHLYAADERKMNWWNLDWQRTCMGATGRAGTFTHRRCLVYCWTELMTGLFWQFRFSGPGVYWKEGFGIFMRLGTAFPT